MTAEQHHTRPRLPLLRLLRRLPLLHRLAAAGALLVAAVASIALLLQNTTSAACAAPPSGNAVRTGKATFYDLGGGTGHCSFATVPADDLYVALGNDQYSTAGACGSYLDVTGPKGKVRVKVIDSCPECLVGHLDLSRTAFKRIADEVQGVVPITYRAVVDAGTAGPLSVRFKDGSSAWWFAVLIDNHANPLTSVKVQGPGGGWLNARRAAYNYWVIDSGAGAGPFSIKVTDTYGNTATATGIRLRPNTNQTTGVRLSDGVVAAPSLAQPKPKKRSSPSPISPSPTPSAANRVTTPAAPVLGSTGVAGTAAAGVPALAAADTTCG